MMKAQDWINVIKVAVDPKSPFRGMVDLREIFTVPLVMQREVFNGLSNEDKEHLKELYGPKKRGRNALEN